MTTFWSLGKVLTKLAYRKRFGCGVDFSGFERTAVFDYCAKGDKAWGSKYCEISEVVIGLSRKILRQGVDHVSSYLHKSPPENEKLSRLYLILSSISLPRLSTRSLPSMYVETNYFPKGPTSLLAHTHTHTHTHTHIYMGMT